MRQLSIAIMGFVTAWGQDSARHEAPGHYPARLFGGCEPREPWQFPRLFGRNPVSEWSDKTAGEDGPNELKSKPRGYPRRKGVKLPHWTGCGPHRKLTRVALPYVESCATAYNAGPTVRSRSDRL